MVTVKRNDSNEKNSGNTALLEREGVISGYKVLEETASATESTEQLHERKARNLDRLLNYEQYSVDAEISKGERISQLIEEVNGVELKNEDIMPSSTTMQFQGQDSAERFYNERANEEKFSFSLNAKGKILIGVYAVVVAVILALIIINTGILNAISGGLNQRSAEVTNLQTEYNQIVEEIETVTSDEYVIDKAENEYNMSK